MSGARRIPRTPFLRRRREVRSDDAQALFRAVGCRRLDRLALHDGRAGGGRARKVPALVGGLDLACGLDLAFLRLGRWSSGRGGGKVGLVEPFQGFRRGARGILRGARGILRGAEGLRPALTGRLAGTRFVERRPELEGVRKLAQRPPARRRNGVVGSLGIGVVGVKLDLRRRAALAAGLLVGGEALSARRRS